MEFYNDLGTDPLKPSLFELVAQEQLRDLLQPALKYVLAVGVLIESFMFYLSCGCAGFRTKISKISPAYCKPA
jgi:hypothetical protein